MEKRKRYGELKPDIRKAEKSLEYVERAVENCDAVAFSDEMYYLGVAVGILSEKRDLYKYTGYITDVEYEDAGEAMEELRDKGSLLQKQFGEKCRCEKKIEKSR